jgi:hypothetical protein
LAGGGRTGTLVSVLRSLAPEPKTIIRGKARLLPSLRSRLGRSLASPVGGPRLGLTVCNDFSEVENLSAPIRGAIGTDFLASNTDAKRVPHVDQAQGRFHAPQ